MLNIGGQTVMEMACGVNYPYIHSNNFEMNRFFFLLIRFEVNQPSHLCYALPNPTLQEMLLVKGWLIGHWTKRKQTNKKRNNLLFTEVAKVACEQFKWGFPMLVIPRVVCLQERSQEEHWLYIIWQSKNLSLKDD